MYRSPNQKLHLLVRTVPAESREILTSVASKKNRPDFVSLEQLKWRIYQIVILCIINLIHLTI